MLPAGGIFVFGLNAFLLLDACKPTVCAGDASFFADAFCGEEPATRRPTDLFVDEVVGACVEAPAAMANVVGPRPLERLMQRGTES